jgi:hypothetical protein
VKTYTRRKQLSTSADNKPQTNWGREMPEPQDFIAMGSHTDIQILTSRV